MSSPEQLRSARVEVEALRVEGGSHEFYGAAAGAAAVLDQAAQAQDEVARRLRSAFGVAATVGAPVT